MYFHEAFESLFSHTSVGTTCAKFMLQIYIHELKKCHAFLVQLYSEHFIALCIS